jgi:serine/threonine protein kinase
MQAERRKYEKANEYRVCTNLLSALEHLRSKRIVHRDLKLENILIRPATSSNEKGYVLCDFGLATWIDE